MSNFNHKQERVTVVKLDLLSFSSAGVFTGSIARHREDVLNKLEYDLYLKYYHHHKADYIPARFEIVAVFHKMWKVWTRGRITQVQPLEAFLLDYGIIYKDAPYCKPLPDWALEEQLHSTKLVVYGIYPLIWRYSPEEQVQQSKIADKWPSKTIDFIEEVLTYAKQVFFAKKKSHNNISMGDIFIELENSTVFSLAELLCKKRLARFLPDIFMTEWCKKYNTLKDYELLNAVECSYVEVWDSKHYEVNVTSIELLSRDKDDAVAILTKDDPAFVSTQMSSSNSLDKEFTSRVYDTKIVPSASSRNEVTDPASSKTEKKKTKGAPTVFYGKSKSFLKPELKNMDPEMKELVYERMKLPYVIHGNNKPIELRGLEQLHVMHPSVRKLIAEKGGLAYVERFSIPAITKFQNVACVGASMSGKTFGTLVGIYNNLLTSECKPRDRPYLLVLCSSQDSCYTAAQIYEDLAKFGGMPQYKMLVSTNYSTKESAAGSLVHKMARGCDILIITPDILKSIITNLGPSLKYLHYLEYIVFDAADELFEVFGYEMRWFIKECIMMSNESWAPKSQYPQTALTAISWTPAVHEFIYRYMDNVLLLIGVGMPLLASSKIVPQMHVLPQSYEADSVTTTIVKNDRRIHRIVIICFTMEGLFSLVRHLRKALKYRILVAHSRKEPMNVLSVGDDWCSSRNPRYPPLLVIDDASLRLVSVQDAEIVIYHEIPPKMIDIADRLRAILLTTPHPFSNNRNVKKPVVHMLMEPRRKQQTLHCIGILRSLGVKVPDDVLRLQKSIEMRERKALLSTAAFNEVQPSSNTPVEERDNPMPTRGISNNSEKNEHHESHGTFVGSTASAANESPVEETHILTEVPTVYWSQEVPTAYWSQDDDYVFLKYLNDDIKDYTLDIKNSNISYIQPNGCCSSWIYLYELIEPDLSTQSFHEEYTVVKLRKANPGGWPRLNESRDPVWHTVHDAANTFEYSVLVAREDAQLYPKLDTEMLNLLSDMGISSGSNSKTAEDQCLVDCDEDLIQF